METDKMNLMCDRIKIGSSNNGLIESVELNGNRISHIKSLSFEMHAGNIRPKINIEFASLLFYDGDCELNVTGIENIPDSLALKIKDILVDRFDN